MFGLTIITKSEKLLWRHQIETQQDEIKRLHEEVARAQKRADAAVNALLARTAKIIIEPQKTDKEIDKEVVDFENLLDRTYGLFEEDEDKAKQQADFMDRLQS